MWTIIIIIVILFFIFYRAFKKQEIENIQIKNSIENDIDEGQKALKSQNYVLALDIFKSIFSKNYTINNEVKASILLKMATCASKMKNTNECIAFLNEAERYNPNEIDIYLIRSAELLQKKLINQRDIELIENDLQQYSKMNIHNTETIKKIYDLLKIRKQEVFSPKKEITQIQNPIFQVTRFKAFEDSYIFKQQQGEEYLGIRNFEKALNCFEYAYKLFASQVTPPIQVKRIN